ncbi:TPA: hypothetical protein ACKPZV_000616 [Stenotrophomonas maltophilia]
MEIGPASVDDFDAMWAIFQAAIATEDALPSGIESWTWLMCM